MRIKSLAMCAAIIAGAALAPRAAPAAALPGAQGTQSANAGTLVEEVRRGRGHHGHRHHGHRHRGHRHFGHHHHRRHFHHRHRHRHHHRHFRPRFYGYGYSYGYCTRVRHRCADRWDWGSRAFYRCLRRHGC
jgi:hypothetical protein